MRLVHNSLHDEVAQQLRDQIFAGTLCQGSFIDEVIADLRKILKLARQQQLHAPGRLEQSLNEHMAIYAALRARDGAGAEAAMRTHLTRQREALKQLATQEKSRQLA
jgi:DNA-binding FadR family transcriptional regulator